MNELYVVAGSVEGCRQSFRILTTYPTEQQARQRLAEFVAQQPRRDPKPKVFRIEFIEMPETATDAMV